MTFEDVRNMDNKELAKWLERIWKVGFNTALISGRKGRECMPDFYDKLSGEE